MKKSILVLTALFFISAPLAAFAESPLSLPAHAKTDAKKHNQEGISQFDLGHTGVALKHFEASEKIQRTGEAYFNEALAYDKLGKHGQATLHFKEAKTLANGNAKILNSEIMISHLKKH
jgi:Flp pilus assembly protein TadD